MGYLIGYHSPGPGPVVVVVVATELRQRAWLWVRRRRRSGVESFGLGMRYGGHPNREGSGESGIAIRAAWPAWEAERGGFAGGVTWCRQLPFWDGAADHVV